MFIPIGDEDKTLRVPFINYAIIAANVLVFFIFTVPMGRLEYHEFVKQWGTVPAQLNPVTLVTSAFLHGGIIHIFGNMLFLWVFGDNIEDRIGHLPYLAFYLGGAIVANLAFAFANAGSSRPAIGASGAVSAVLGAYAVMLPRVKVRVLYFIYYRAGTFTVSAVYAMGYWAILQVVDYFQLEAQGLGGVAYSAHLGGFGFGLAAGTIAALVLRERWREERPSEPLSARPLKSRYARDAARKLREFEERPSREPRPLTRSYAADAQQNIVNLLAQGKEDEALEQYLAFIRRFRHASLPTMEQIRVADLFLVRKEYRTAQEAYERFLRHFPESTHADDVRYNLAMLCAQYTQDYSTARRLLRELARTTGDSVRLAELEEELKRIEEHFAKIYAEPAAGEDSGAGGAEKFAVFRQSGGRINISEVGRVIAAMLKLPLADVTTRLFTCSGFLADNLSKSQAEVLARDLQRINIPVFLVEQDQVRQLPEAVLVEDGAFGPEGFSTLVDGQDEIIPWDSILMVNAGLLESSRTKEVPLSADVDIRPRSAMGFGPRKRKTSLVKQTQQRVVIDVLVSEPYLRLRIQEGFTRFSLLGERKLPTVRENLERLAQEVLRHADRTFVGEAVSALARHGSLTDFVYENRRKYDLANFWLAHRALYDQPA